MSTPPTVPYSANPTEPRLIDVLNLWKKDIFLEFNSTQLATVKEFDAVKQTATASINYKQTYFTLDVATGLYRPTLVDYPVLIDCPVVIVGGAAGALTCGSLVGQECLVLFNDRDINNWFAGLGDGAVATSRLHSFADGLILVGVRSLANVLDNYDSVRITLRSKAGETVVGVNPDTHKVLITNTAPGNATTLNTLLQNLIDAVLGLTINGSDILTGASAGAPCSGTATVIDTGGAVATAATAIEGLLE